MRVMIVEDETLIRLELAQRLRLLGHEVVASTGSGEEAVELARLERPELIRMDVPLRATANGIAAPCAIAEFSSRRALGSRRGPERTPAAFPYNQRARYVRRDSSGRAWGSRRESTYQVVHRLAAHRRSWDRDGG